MTSKPWILYLSECGERILMRRFATEKEAEDKGIDYLFAGVCSDYEVVNKEEKNDDLQAV